MCQGNILAALQTEVHDRIKIDSPDISVNAKMEQILDQVTLFVNTPRNHTQDALDEFKKFELFIIDLRRSLTTKVSTAKKNAAADERRAETERKAERKRREKEEASAERKLIAERKRKQKTALLNLSKMLKKPKSPIAGKDDNKVLKWAWVGAKSNYAPTKKAANKAARDAKKALKEEEAAARKIANAGKPKNGDYARFCKWFKADEDDITAAGCANKRDYNKHVWAAGYELDWNQWCDPEIFRVWDEFKKSSDAPWNATDWTFTKSRGNTRGMRAI